MLFDVGIYSQIYCLERELINIHRKGTIIDDNWM